MRKVIAALLACGLLMGVSLHSANAGADLDNFVNCFRLDQKTAAYDKNTYFAITPDKPVGQTFVTGPDTVALSRIALKVATWSEEWADGESLVLTVWDSLEKKTKLASYSMPFKWKTWELQVIMFPLNNVPVKPNTSYYFELTADGGNRSISGIFASSEDYKSGQAHSAGKPESGDLWFETHVKKTWNKDSDYAYYFDHWNLNYQGMEKVKTAVTKKDWDTAVKELVAYYEGRKDLVEHKIPKKNPKYDRSYPDLVASQKIKDQEGTVWELGPDWNHYMRWPLRGGVGLTRAGIRRDLVGGYQNTADEKFAKAWNDMILCTLRDQPCPLRAGAIVSGSEDIDAAPDSGIQGGTMWSALSIAARMNQIWHYYSGMVTSPNFTTDARCEMIFNMVDMADVLSIMKGGGNWETQRSSGLFEFAQAHPELKKSKEWFAEGFGGLVQNCLDTVYPDGSLHEASMNYHGLVTNRFLILLEDAKKLGIDVPRAMRNRVEKMVEYIMYSTEPGWFCPGTGDTFNYWSGEDLLARGAKYFNRSDMLWVATHGKEGTVPMSLSVPFKYSGWYAMRTGWDKDARFLYTHNGDNDGHGHDDALQTVITAYGSELLVDPGVYVYGTAETGQIAQTAAHSTITVDGKGVHQVAGPSTWESNGRYDYYDGTNAGYHDLDGVKMRRRIVFLKPDYWIVLDNITGSGTHKLDSRFVCAAGKANATGKSAVFTDGKNGLVVASPSDDKTSVSIDTGKWARYGKLEPVPVIKKSADTTLPFTSVQALVPFRGTKAPKVSVESAALADGSVKVTVLFPESGRIDTAIFAGDGKIKVSEK